MTINGIGERAGNTSMEEVVMALATRKDLFDYYTDIVTQYIYPTSRLVSKLTGMMVQPNKAIVGANAFAHESGIHQDGGAQRGQHLRDHDAHRRWASRRAPCPWGSSPGAMRFGKSSRRWATTSADEELNRVFVRFKDLADRKKTVFDEDLVILVETEVIYKSVPEYFRLLDLVVLTGTMVQAQRHGQDGGGRRDAPLLRLRGRPH